MERKKTSKINPGSPSKCPYRFPGRDAPRCLQTPVRPARDNPGSPCERTPCSGEARFQRGTPGSFGDWLYHFRGEIAARRQPRFIRRLTLSLSGARLQRGGTPGSFGDWLYHFRGEIAARRQPRFIRRLALSFSGKARFQRGRTTPVRQASAFSFLFFYSFEAKRKKRTSTKPIWRAGPREAITCVQINHEVEQRKNKGRRGWRALRPPRVVFVTV